MMLRVCDNKKVTFLADDEGARSRFKHILPRILRLPVRTAIKNFVTVAACVSEDFGILSGIQILI